VGGCKRIDTEHAIQEAVDLAATFDQVVVCVGLSGEWESEGFDRPHMNLPPMSDQLVQRVLDVQPNAAVVVQSGTPVTMSWARDAKALLHAWYGGNETGHGIADVIFGNVNPVSIEQILHYYTPANLILSLENFLSASRSSSSKTQHIFHIDQKQGESCIARTYTLAIATTKRSK
jgi:hypothetical protein